MTDKPEGPDLFAHPSPTEFDYRPLLLALRECRFRVMEFMARTVTRLTRVPGAAKFLRQKAKEPGGKWPAGKPPDV